MSRHSTEKLAKRERRDERPGVGSGKISLYSEISEVCFKYQGCGGPAFEALFFFRRKRGKLFSFQRMLGKPFIDV